MNKKTLGASVITFAVWLSLLIQGDAKDVEFRARIDEIKISRQFEKPTIVTGVDPRYVVSLTLEQDVEGIGKHGDSVRFAIHSPVRDLRISDQRAAVGTQILLKLSLSKKSGIKFLSRVEESKARQASPSDDKKQEN